MSDSVITDALGLIPRPVATQELVVVNETRNDHDAVAADAEFARETLLSLVQSGQEALDELMILAKQAQHPRAFEVIGGLINTIAGATGQLVDTHKKVADIRKTVPATGAVEPGTTNVTQNLFVGSTAELQKMIEDAKSSRTD